MREIRVSGTSGRLMEERLSQDLNGVWPEFMADPDNLANNYFRPDWDFRKVGKGHQCRLAVTDAQLADIVWRLERIAEDCRYLMTYASESDPVDGMYARACEKDAKRLREENPDLFTNERASAR